MLSPGGKGHCLGSQARFGQEADAGHRIPYPGQYFAIAHMDELSRRTGPRGIGVQVAELRVAIKRMGPCIVLGHSQVVAWH